MKQPSISKSELTIQKKTVLFGGWKLSCLSHNFLLFSDVCVQKRFWTLVSSMSYRSFILSIRIGIELLNNIINALSQMMSTLENDKVPQVTPTFQLIPTYDAPFFVVAYQSSEDRFGLICRSYSLFSFVQLFLGSLSLWAIRPFVFHEPYD